MSDTLSTPTRGTSATEETWRITIEEPDDSTVDADDFQRLVVHRQIRVRDSGGNVINTVRNVKEAAALGYTNFLPKRSFSVSVAKTRNPTIFSSLITDIEALITAAKA